MGTVRILSRDELLARREELLGNVGLPEDELRQRAAHYELSADQIDALEEIDEIDFLLAD